MRKLAVAMALASTALLTTPTLARDKSWYAGADGGGMIVENTNFNIAGLQSGGQTHDRYGYDVDGVIGYDFGAFRIESEVAYKRANVKSYQSSTTTPARIAGGGLVNVNPGTFDYAGGRQSALSFMVNGMLDFGDDNGIQGFVGGGAGVARIKDRIALNTFGSFIHDSDTRFAYQGIAGIRAPLGDHLDVSLKYRFFTAPKLRMFDVTGREFDSRFRSHSLMGGLTYNFGSPPAPPPPPPPPVEAAPPPPPPPPPPAVVCAPGPFIVFFDWDKSDITPEASSILDNAVTQYMSCGNAQVMLAGHADRSGSASYNVGLSQRRADSVKAYLSAHTIPEGVITTQAFGESRPRVETADGVREVQNRRVEVTYGPGSGT